MQTQSKLDLNLLRLRSLHPPLADPQEQPLSVLLKKVGKQDEKHKEEKTDGDRGCNDDCLVRRSLVDHLRLKFIGWG